MHVMAVSTVTDDKGFWNALKKAHGRLPREASWAFAVASTDGGTAVNIIVHDSLDSVRDWFQECAGPFATTTFTEADAANAVGLK